MWGGQATRTVGASPSNRAVPTSPIATSATPVGATAAAVATPSKQEKYNWYLYQQTHEGD
ncbi:MAG TPA: hypothetical protein VMW65_09200 [Chloroflexota bacterium]|nr:hypothetical protein [Chloroflexota bacterium]